MNMNIKHYTLIPLAILGVFFISIMVHEVVHVAQAKEPLNVCWNIGQNVLAFTTYNIEAESTHTFDRMDYWERTATLIQWGFNMLLSFILGWMMNTAIKKYTKGDEE